MRGNCAPSPCLCSRGGRGQKDRSCLSKHNATERADVDEVHLRVNSSRRILMPSEREGKRCTAPFRTRDKSERGVQDTAERKHTPQPTRDTTRTRNTIHKTKSRTDVAYYPMFRPLQGVSDAVNMMENCHGCAQLRGPKALSDATNANML